MSAEYNSVPPEPLGGNEVLRGIGGLPSDPPPTQLQLYIALFFMRHPTVGNPDEILIWLTTQMKFLLAFVQAPR